jgi:hypothetical protein
MPKKKARAPLGRSLRRKLSRLADQEGRRLAAALAELPGGAPDRPLRVESSAVIEPRATREPCPFCGGDVEVVEHLARTVGAERLREVVVRCRGCGKRRSLWFALAESVLH